MVEEPKNKSDARWRMAGFTVVILAVVAIAGAIGVGLTRSESTPVTTATPLDAQKPKKIAVIGDSYTGGTDQGGVGSNSWVELAMRQLRKEGFDVSLKVSAIGGTGYVARGQANSTLAEETLPVVQPDDSLVIMFGGLNDAREPTEKVADGVRKALSNARGKSPGAQLLVVGPAWPAPDPPPQMLAIRDTIRREARDVGATFVDPIADRWFVNNPELIGADGIHPTDAGHLYLADKLIPVIKAALTPQPVPSG